MINRFLTVEQVAEEMGVGPKTAQRWCRDGSLKADKVLGKWTIQPSSLEVLKANRKRKRGRRAPSPTMIENPKRARRKILKDDRPNMQRIHERADKMVAAKQEALNKAFPNGASYQEIYEYVLYNMAQRG